MNHLQVAIADLAGGRGIAEVEGIDGLDAYKASVFDSTFDAVGSAARKLVFGHFPALSGDGDSALGVILIEVFEGLDEGGKVKLFEPFYDIDKRWFWTSFSPPFPNR